MNASSDDLSPELRSLAHRLSGLPLPGPDAAAQSRMRMQLERTISEPRSPWWMRRLYLGAIVAALALGLGAAGAASRSPIDLVRDPGGVVQDIYRSVTGDDSGSELICPNEDEDPTDGCDDVIAPANTPAPSTTQPATKTPAPSPTADDDDDNSDPGTSDDDVLKDGNSGPGSGDDDDRDDDNSRPGSGDDDDPDDDNSGRGSSDDGERHDDNDEDDD
jgi:hypothetical protein